MAYSLYNLEMSDAKSSECRSWLLFIFLPHCKLTLKPACVLCQWTVHRPSLWGTGSGYPFFRRQSPRTPCLLTDGILAAGTWFSRGSRLTPGSSDHMSQRKFCGLFTGDHNGDPLLLRFIYGKPLRSSKALCKFLGSSGAFLRSLWQHR